MKVNIKTCSVNNVIIEIMWESAIACKRACKKNPYIVLILIIMAGISVLASHTLQRYCNVISHNSTSFSGTNNVFFCKKKKKKITNNFFFCYKYRLFLKRHWRNQPLTSTPVSPDDYIVYDGTIFCFVYSVHVIYELRTCLRASSCNFVVNG